MLDELHNKRLTEAGSLDMLEASDDSDGEGRYRGASLALPGEIVSSAANLSVFFSLWVAHSLRLLLHYVSAASGSLARFAALLVFSVHRPLFACHSCCSQETTSTRTPVVLRVSYFASY